MLLLIGTLVLMAANAMADQEPNDNTTAAEMIIPGHHVGSLTRDYDASDFYRFVVGHGQVIRLEFIAYNDDYFLYAIVTDAKGGIFFEVASVANRQENGTWYTSSLFIDQSIFLEVMTLSGSGGYSFNLTLGQQDDGGLGKDAGDNITIADPLTPGHEVTGLLMDGDIIDTYKFLAGTGDIIIIEYWAPAQKVFLVLYDPEGCLTVEKDMQAGSHKVQWFTANETERRHWYIKVWYDIAGTTYKFKVSLGQQDDARTWTDVPGTFEGAHEVEEDVLIEGYLRDMDVCDIYKVQLQEGDYLHIFFTSNAYGDVMYLELCDWEHLPVLNMTSGWSDTEEGMYWTANDPGPDLYHFVIWMDMVPGAYTLEFNLGRQDDAGSGGDAAAQLTEALGLENGQVTSGMLMDEDIGDAYSFQVEPGDTIEVELSSDTEDFQRLTLIDAAEDVLFSIHSEKGTATTGKHWTAAETEGGTWYVRISTMAYRTESFGHYNLTVTIGHQDDAGTGGDGPEGLLEGLELDDGEHSGQFGSADMGDAYNFRAQTGWVVSLTLDTTSALPIEATIWSDEGNSVVETITASKDAAGEWQGRVPSGVTPGTLWYVLVAPRTNASMERYTLSIEITRIPYDVEKPIIVAYDLPQKAVKGKERTISILATDNEAVTSVRLYFKTNIDMTWTELRMAKDGDDYMTIIPNIRFDESHTINYYIVAEDGAGNQANIGTERVPMSMDVTSGGEESPGPGAVLALVVISLLAAALGTRRR